MTQQNAFYIPDHAAMDQSEMLRIIKAMASPECYGAELGLAWALSVSSQVLQEAAFYPTVEERLQEQMSIHQECDQAEFPDDDIKVIAPDSGEGVPRERMDFFLWARDTHLAFGWTLTPEDPGARYRHDDGQFYFVLDAPNCAFRLFEMGWTTAVREIYAGMCKL